MRLLYHFLWSYLLAPFIKNQPISTMGESVMLLIRCKAEIEGYDYQVIHNEYKGTLIETRLKTFFWLFLGNREKAYNSLIELASLENFWNMEKEKEMVKWLESTKYADIFKQLNENSERIDLD